jgi:SAM-dependent methyltransferase
MDHPELPLAKTSFRFQRVHTRGLRGTFLRYLPRPVKSSLKSLLQLPLDGVDALLRRRPDLVPPRYLNFTGDGDFEKTGNEFFRYFVELANLRPQDRVLEVGCGIGRMAGPLTRYLTKGSYDGIDIVPRGIKWCQRNITSRYPRFRFHLADLRNLQYNPKGKLKATEYHFPFADQQFDFVFLTSVFTHMLRPDMEHYFGEIARVTRPGGVCFVTLFLLTDESLTLIDKGLSSLEFRTIEDGCWIIDPRIPEYAVGYEYEPLQGLWRRLGFEQKVVRYGAWSGRSDYLSFQDVVVLTKAVA